MGFFFSVKSKLQRSRTFSYKGVQWSNLGKVIFYTILFSNGHTHAQISLVAPIVPFIAKSSNSRVTHCMLLSHLFRLLHSEAVLSFSLKTPIFFKAQANSFVGWLIVWVGLNLFLRLHWVYALWEGRRCTFKDLIILFLKQLENDYQCNPIFNLHEKSLRKKSTPMFLSIQTFS